ncbi:uncharacterized protein TNCV_4884431 [Trichonephila clavipes]|nr:uncharacterized protein TNCV_4884431 [Trichonephila clavipes]
MEQNIGQSEYFQFLNLSQTNWQEDDILAYIQHSNALCSDFEIRYKDILTMVIIQWLINPYNGIEETYVVLHDELIRISTNEELKSHNCKEKYGRKMIGGAVRELARLASLQTRTVCEEHESLYECRVSGYPLHLLTNQRKLTCCVSVVWGKILNEEAIESSNIHSGASESDGT